MHMVGHENVCRTKQSFARGRMEEQLAKLRVKQDIQPALGAALERDGPMNDSEPAIEFGRQPGEMVPIGLRGQRNWLHGMRLVRLGKSAALCREPLRNHRCTRAPPPFINFSTSSLLRSEERRVGKECRSGWLSYS